MTLVEVCLLFHFQLMILLLELVDVWVIGDVGTHGRDRSSEFSSVQ